MLGVKHAAASAHMSSKQAACAGAGYRRVPASPTLLRCLPQALRFRLFTAACMDVAQPGESVWRARARELAIGQLKSACLWGFE